MDEEKTNILQTVIEDLKVKSTTTKVKTPGISSGQNLKMLKNGRTRKTKKVVVKLPSMQRRFENEHKIFPKGIESVRRSLEEIKEEAREGKTEEEDNMPTNREPLKDIIPNGNGADKISSMNGTEEPQEANRLSDPVYGMFTRTNTERSLLSNTSDSFSLLSPPATNRKKSLFKRPRTASGWSKKDLEIFLPKKSFFSVHDNTLSAAGFDVRSDEERKRPEWRKFLKMHTLDELYPKEEQKEEKPITAFANIDDDSEDEDNFGLENVETAVSSENKDAVQGAKPRRRQQKKATNSEKEEYKPLYDYLKHIHDNPEDYIQQTKYTVKNTDHKHPSFLVRLGRAFRRGHHGAVSHNIYLHAIGQLKAKMVEPSQQRNTRGDKGVIKKESNENSEQTNPDETEFQRLKNKAENWMRVLTTQQFMKAKELALKDIGEEDINITKWWLAFKSCHYLRMPQHFSDS